MFPAHVLCMPGYRTCEAEHTFSTLRCIKSYLRLKTTQMYV